MKNSRSVYSTELGRLCPKCESPVDKCVCSQDATIYENDGFVRLQLETKGRKGKGVTLVEGIPGKEKDIKAIAKKLKQKLSTGGAVKNGVIEIQGDLREKLKTELESQGFKIKISGK